MTEMGKYLKRVGDDLWFTETDRDNLKIDYRIKDIVFSETSPFQHIMIDLILPLS